MSDPAGQAAPTAEEVRNQLSPVQRALTLWRGRALGLLVLAVCVLWHSVIVEDGDLIRLTQLDVYQQASPREAKSDIVVIVAVDEKAIAEQGQWPWPRSRVASLITETATAGALAIGLDILFLDPDRQSPGRAISRDAAMSAEVRQWLDLQPDYDALLSDVLTRTWSVLALAGTRHGKGLNGRPPPAAIAFQDLELLERLHDFPGADRSIPEVADAAASRGLVNAIEDSDAIVRRVPLVASVHGQPAPGFALEVLRIAKEADMEVLGDEGGISGIRVGDWLVHALPDGTMYVPFSPPWADRYVSAHDVLIGDPETLAKLDGKIVLIGLTGQGLVDFPTSPLRDRMPGIEVHAQVIESIAEDVSIDRPGWGEWAELALILLAGGFFVFVVPRLKVFVSGPAVIVVLVLILLAGVVFYDATGIVIYTFGPALSAVLVGIAMLLTTLMLSAAQRRVLAVNLQLQREERARVQGELDAARDIQFNLLPKLEDVHINDNRYSLSAGLEPARDVGGDLYDFFLIDDDHLFIAVGDVAGKGVPASLFMAIAKALFKSAVMRGIQGIEEITFQANNEISRENPDMLFVTLFAGIVNLNTGEMAFCNAGHEPPLVFQPGSGETPKPLEGGGGPPICVVDDFPYMPAEHRFEPGQMMLITTDGVGEAMNEAGELYGNDRLYGLLGDLQPDADAEEIRWKLYKDVKAHAGTAPASDDLTVMGLRWFGPGAG